MVFRAASCAAIAACVATAFVPDASARTHHARAHHQHKPGHHRRLKPTQVRRLSNETTFTRVAEANSTAKIRVKPRFHARGITRLRFYTPDVEAVQTYLVLRQERIGRHVWVKLRVPMRPNGRVGWVQRKTLGRYFLTHTQVVVNRRDFTLTVYRSGKKVFATRVGVGRPSLPTPAGHFWITESFPSTDAAYGPWAFGTSDYATFQTEFSDGSVVGIHGTDMPWLIPGRPSHGCVRLHDAAVLKLKKFISIGTALRIR